MFPRIPLAHTCRALACGVLLHAIAAAPAAQNYHGAATPSPWHPSLQGSFHAVSSGHYDPGVMLDAVVHVGSQLVLLPDPGQQTFFVPFGVDVTSFVHLPRPAGGAVDRILAVEAARVAVYEWDGGAGSMDAGTPIAGLHPQPDSVDLVVDPIDGIPRLGGLESDLRTLYIGTLSGPPLTYVEEGRFTLGEEVRSWQMMQWDGAPGLEFLVHTQTEFHVLSATGTPLVMSVAAPGARSLLERFHDSELGVDRGFWFTEFTGPHDFIGFLFDHRYPPDVEPALLFGPIDVGQIGFFDYDGDQRKDMWFSTATTDEAYLLYGYEEPVFPIETTFGLNLEQTTVIPMNGNPDTGVDSMLPSYGATGDFDLDGDVDFLFVNDDHAHVNFIRGDAFDEGFLLPDIHEHTLTQVSLPGEEMWTFDLDVSIPWPTYPRESGVSVIKSIRIEVFFQPEIGAPIDPTPLVVLDQPIFEAVLPTTRVKREFTPQTPTSLGAPVDVDDHSEPPAGTQGIGEIIGIPVSFEVTDDPAVAVYQFRLTLLGASSEQIGPALIAYYADDEETSNTLASQYIPWTVADPDNGFGFHRRGGIGGFCALCP